MVVLHVKKGDESLFLYQTTCDVPLDKLIPEVTAIHNARLRVERLCDAARDLSHHGVYLPPNMQGLTQDQIDEMHLVDDWGQKCRPMGGCVANPDPMGRRNGEAMPQHYADVIEKACAEALAVIHKNQVAANVCLNEKTIKDVISTIGGAITMAYPMGLPPHEVVRAILEDDEDLSGTQASQAVIDVSVAQLWWAGKELLKEKKLGDFIGRNEKTKIIVKIQKRGGGAPVREPAVDEETQKRLMALYYKKQEEFKKLESDESDAYLGAAWADTSSLKQHLRGVDNVSWRPR
eukprot:Opistho-2@7872